jgi:hypothetical protein
MKKTEEQAQNVVTGNTIYKDVLQLQQEMQQAILNDLPSNSNLVSVQMPCNYTPNDTFNNFSNNTLKTDNTVTETVEEISEAKIVNAEQAAFPNTKNLIKLVDDSDDEEHEIGYQINFNGEIESKIENTTILTSGKSIDEKQIEQIETTIVAIEQNTTNNNNLSKLISLSDRYLFINELFKGEESNFERSLKAIQNFETLKDASFWIERELVTKQGWRKDDETVELFMDLVNRRFA